MLTNGEVGNKQREIMKKVLYLIAAAAVVAVAAFVAADHAASFVRR